MSLNEYYDEERIKALIRDGQHQEVIGGKWEQLGKLQFDFLRAAGLEPHHKLLDIGCGSLRGGVKFIDYLDSGNYFGTDLSAALLDAGYTIELAERGLTDKLPRANLVADGNFDFAWSPVQFDFALAQSVFSHLPLNHIRACLENLHPAMAPGGSFFATIFQIADDWPSARPLLQKSGVETYGTRDPYHYRAADIEFCTRHLPWRVVSIAEWGHPGSQRMVHFRHEP